MMYLLYNICIPNTHIVIFEKYSVALQNILKCTRIFPNNLNAMLYAQSLFLQLHTDNWEILIPLTGYIANTIHMYHSLMKTNNRQFLKLMYQWHSGDLYRKKNQSLWQALYLVTTADTLAGLGGGLWRAKISLRWACCCRWLNLRLTYQ